ncbi:GNAT family N-acetyltransferase [Labrenzia sp. PHM005]|uniref:GNAT family N-acetyltransferase n=1 Tax=Labrenzia sp. PHM005 TaxID=2590016 RepID=UPI0011407A7A|nr:GNAT family N-acetyltransferase [Labrenzia sp. PHM005]QDG76129.1 GNAT family N-acetyltransferase [Labrenzia sp. PHM005]
MNRQAAIDVSDYRIETSDAYDFLSDHFSALFDRSSATAFQGPLWLEQFYKTIVPGAGATPIIVTIYLNGSQDPAVVIPLVRETHFGIQIIQPADLGVADYNAVIGSDENLEVLAKTPSFSKDLLKAIRPYDLILFRKQPPWVFDAAQLFSGAEKRPNISSSYEAVIGRDYDQWLNNVVSKNMRKGLRRKRNGFEKDYGELSFHELAEEKEIDEAFKLMRELRAARYEDDLFSRLEYFQFYRNVAVLGSQQGIASTFVGKFEDQIISVDFGLRQNDRFLFLLGGFSNNEEYQRYSLGLIGLCEKIRDETERGRTIFDFTIGDEDYKQSFRADRIPLTNVTATSGLVGRLAFSAYQSRGSLRGVLKKLMPKFN